MTPRVALVASTTADDPAWLVGARLRHLLDSGWDARLLAKGEAWSRALELREPDLSEHVELAPGKRESAFDHRLRALRPHVVHFHSGWAAWKETAGAQPREFRVAISFREDGQDLEVPDLERLVGSAGLLLFGAQGSLDSAVARGCPPERCTVLPPPGLGPSSGSVQEAPGNGALRILSAGPLTWEQGLEHSIQAVRLLVDMGIPCEYRVVGEGAHVEAVAFARHQLGVHEQVELVDPGSSEGLEEELHRADVFVDAAVTDTTPSVALDSALAHGVPFVATTRRRELPGGAGVTVGRRDPRAMAGALAQLANDPTLRERMGREARNAGVDWSLEDHLAEHERLLRTILEP